MKNLYKILMAVLCAVAVFALPNFAFGGEETTQSNTKPEASKTETVEEDEGQATPPNKELAERRKRRLEAEKKGILPKSSDDKPTTTTKPREEPKVKKTTIADMKIGETQHLMPYRVLIGETGSGGINTDVPTSSTTLFDGRLKLPSIPITVQRLSEDSETLFLLADVTETPYRFTRSFNGNTRWHLKGVNGGMVRFYLSSTKPGEYMMVKFKYKDKILDRLPSELLRKRASDYKDGEKFHVSTRFVHFGKPAGGTEDAWWVSGWGWASDEPFEDDLGKSVEVTRSVVPEHLRDRFLNSCWVDLDVSGCAPPSRLDWMDISYFQAYTLQRKKGERARAPICLFSRGTPRNINPESSAKPTMPR